MCYNLYFYPTAFVSSSYISLYVYSTPYMFYSYIPLHIYILLHMCPTPCISHSIYVPLCVGSILCIFHSYIMCIPFYISTTFITYSIYMSHYVSHSMYIFHSVYVLLLYLIPCESPSLHIQLLICPTIYIFLFFVPLYISYFYFIPHPMFHSMCPLNISHLICPTPYRSYSFYIPLSICATFYEFHFLSICFNLYIKVLLVEFF